MSESDEQSHASDPRAGELNTSESPTRSDSARDSDVSDPGHQPDAGHQPDPGPEPAAPAVNPFQDHAQAGVQPDEVTGPDGRPKLPPCFEPLAGRLPSAILAKLRLVDVSSTNVVILTPAGRKSDPQPLSWFVEDFGAEAAQLVGTTGVLRVAIYEQGKQPWGFGFRAESAGGRDRGEVEELRALLREMADQQQKFMESVRMELVLSGGGNRGGGGSDDFEREMARFERFSTILKNLNSGNDPGEQMVRTFEGMGRALEGFNGFREKASSLAGHEPDGVDQFNRLTENPVVQKGIELGFQRVLGQRGEAARAGELPAPAEPAHNPFKEGVA